MVSRGQYKATMAGEHLLDIELAKGVPVRSAFVLDERRRIRLRLRKRNPKLKHALDAFVKRIYKSEFYNITYTKYFKSQRSVQRLARGRVVDPLNGQISPYDEAGAQVCRSLRFRLAPGDRADVPGKPV